LLKRKELSKEKGKCWDVIKVEGTGREELATWRRRGEGTAYIQTCLLAKPNRRDRGKRLPPAEKTGSMLGCIRRAEYYRND